MKINKIQDSKIYTLKPKDNQKNTQNNQLENHHTTTLPSNPKYFQALNYINFKSNFIAMPKFKDGTLVEIKLRMPISHDCNITLKLDKEDSIEVFTNKDNKLDESALDFFAKYYASFYKTRKEMYEKEKATLLSIINYNPTTKLRVIDPKKDLQTAMLKSESSSNETYGENILDSLDDLDTKKEFATRRLNRIEREFRVCSITIAKELIIFLRLSKQQNDTIDILNSDERLSIATLLTYYNSEVEKDCTEYIFSLSKNKNGKIDLTFCHTLLEYLANCTKGESPQKEIYQSAQLIRKYQQQDSKNYPANVQDVIEQHHLEDISAF